MANETMIAQVLAAQAAAGPPKLGGPYPELPTPLNHVIIYGVYAAVEARRRGWSGSDKEVERNVRLARRAKIAEAEIEAAIAAGEED